MGEDKQKYPPKSAEKARLERAKKCREEIVEILNKHSCRVEVDVTIHVGGVNSFKGTWQVVAK